MKRRVIHWFRNDLRLADNPALHEASASDEVIPIYILTPEIMSRLGDLNIPSMIYYRIPLHMQSVHKKLGYIKGDFPNAEKVASQIFSIPMHPYLRRSQQDKIIEVLNYG